MSIIDQFLSVLAPYECFGCQTEGSLLCKRCLHYLPRVAALCYRCHVSTNGSHMCFACSQRNNLDGMVAATAYAGLSKKLVGQLKFSGAQSVARCLAAQIAPYIRSEFIVVPVPTASSRVRSRGYDQAKLLARELSRQTRLPYRDFLIRTGQSHQVGASRTQRQSQLSKAFRLRNVNGLKGANILLIDDVITTGATIETAAAICKEYGAQKVVAAAFARA